MGWNIVISLYKIVVYYSVWIAKTQLHKQLQMFWGFGHFIFVVF
jgi:hypothetical protein